MDAQHLVRDLYSAIEAREFDRALRYLASDFQFSRLGGGAGEPGFPDVQGSGSAPESLVLNSLQWIRMHRAFAAAMPDLTINYIPNGESYGVVHGSVQLIGTHTDLLDLRMTRVPLVPTTGKRITLPREKVDVAVQKDKVIIIQAERLPDGGIMGLLAQMGVALPYV